MKIISWNVNSIKARLIHLKDLLIEHNPDILLLQETKCTNENFPHEELDDFGYNIYVNGQKSYNGVAIFSKFKCEEIILDFPNNPCPQESRFIHLRLYSPIGFVNIINVYVPNGGEAYSEKFSIKLKFYDALTSYLKSLKHFDEKIIIAGDFNVAPFNIDAHSKEDVKDSTCCTQIEKDKFRTLLNSGLVDFYRMLNKDKQEFSWWDYRGGKFEQNKGLRIDMILLSYNAVNDFSHNHIDFNHRTKVQPSDHAPIIIY